MWEALRNETNNKTQYLKWLKQKRDYEDQLTVTYGQYTKKRLQMMARDSRNTERKRDTHVSFLEAQVWNTNHQTISG